MPYIKKNNRSGLDLCIAQLINRIKANLPENKENLSNEDFLAIAGEINYSVSRICASLIGDVSYGKIAVATGVLENIKQELYRRIAEPYENLKIAENGDIQEYKSFPIDHTFKIVDKDARQFEFEM
jgi:hypothetical protein